ncbi:phospholipase D/nuclease [Tuber magnatum]|uniref:Phospholipase D/nuclease n=1 Tax=Tuber magnatum TaxID=42249 RepID=A0A317T3N6_9PEZI|nr:phospholipase D/nuclease [Tuber magnatum]
MDNTYEISDSDSGGQEDEERQIAEAIRLSLLESSGPPAQGESSNSRSPQRRTGKRKVDVIEIVSDDDDSDDNDNDNSDNGEEDDGILDGINATRKAPKASNNSSARVRAVGIPGVTGPAMVSEPADGLPRMIGNRAQMERERLARLAELKRSPPEFELLLDGATPKTPRPVGARLSCFFGGGFTQRDASTIEPSRFSADNKKRIQPHGSQLRNDGDPSGATPGLLRYPNGAIKRTWADGYPKTDTEITFEEVLQKDSLCVAVLSAFQWDIDWVLQKLPLDSIQRLVMVMHAKEEQDRSYKVQQLGDLPKTTLVLPPMQGQVSCMHSKLMLLFHMSGNQKWLRVAVPSANLTDYDWGELGGVMENTVFIIDLPRLPKPDHNQTHFAQELHHFCTAKGMPEDVLNGLYQYDFSKTKDMAFVHSIGGSNIGKNWHRTGYSGLGTAVKALGLSSGPGLEFDFVTSSLGAANMGFISNMYRAAMGDNGLRELQRCVNKPAKGAKKKKSVLVIDDEITDDDSGAEFDEETNLERIMNHVRIYFPSYETVRLSKKGFNSGGTICFNSSWWDSPTFPKSLMRDCVSTRDGLLMHNKMLFARPSRQLRASCGRVDAWAYVGSANLSESAW